MLPAAELIDRAENLAARLPAAMSTAIGGLPGELRSTAEPQRFAERIAKRSETCLDTVAAARRHRLDRH